MHGQAAKRTVAHFGYRYEYESWKLVPTDPLPEALAWLRERAGELAEVAPEAFAETLVTRYPPGAGIGWHRDAPLFGPVVVGVSLLSACSMRFQRRTSGSRQTYSLELAPRSAYVLSGPARTSWQHSIPRTRGLRYSVTFRTVVAGRMGARVRRVPKEENGPGSGGAGSEGDGDARVAQ
jgi:alkylated DNA repair protein (DNA oxidative demethylase)